MDMDGDGDRNKNENRKCPVKQPRPDSTKIEEVVQVMEDGDARLLLLLDLGFQEIA